MKELWDLERVEFSGRDPSDVHTFVFLSLSFSPCISKFQEFLFFRGTAMSSTEIQFVTGIGIGIVIGGFDD